MYITLLLCILVEFRHDATYETETNNAYTLAICRTAGPPPLLLVTQI